MYDMNWNFDLKTLFKVSAHSLTTCTVYVKHYLQCTYLLFEKTHRPDYTLYNTSSSYIYELGSLPRHFKVASFS